MNGATCSNVQESYLCDCKVGYTGSNCETGNEDLPLLRTSIKINTLNKEC